MTDFIHPFETCGLGKAPFNFSHFKVLLHYSSYQIDGTPDPYAETRAGGTCDYCGHVIKDGYFFKSSDDKTFVVGSDCAKKAYVKSEKEWKLLKQAMREAKGVHIKAEKQALRLQEQRIMNEKKGLGYYTNNEIATFKREENNKREEERLLKLNEKKALSEWVGKVKDTQLFKLTINYTNYSENSFGTSFFHIMTDEEGNTVMNNGSNSLGKKGDKIEVKATIKAHTTSNEGFKQTIITRAKMKTLKVLDIL